MVDRADVRLTATYRDTADRCLLRWGHTLRHRRASHGSETVTGAGKPLELTVHRYAERLAIHERAHVKQIEHIIGAR